MGLLETLGLESNLTLLLSGFLSMPCDESATYIEK